VSLRLICANISLLVVCLGAGSACRRATTAADAEGPTFSVTHWTDKTELFMEHPALVASKSARFAVHLTKLGTFQALTEGRPSIELRGSEGRVTSVPGTTALRPGAFRVEGVMPAAGKYEWRLKVDAGALQDVHELGTVTVYPSDEAARAAPQPTEGAPGIAYLKEQQWTNEFATIVVRPERVRRSVRVPASIVAPAGGEASVTAPAAGRLVATRLPQIGDRVAAGTVLARFEPRISAVEDRATLVQQTEEARAAVQAAELDQQRAERLLAEKAVPARRLEDANRNLTVARSQLRAAETRLAQRDQTLRAGGAGAGGNTFELRAPIAGTITEVVATPGAAYEEGAELFHIVRTNPVVVEAHLPPSEVGMRGMVTDLAFELPGENTASPLRIRRQADPGVVDAQSRAIALRFEVDNDGGQLLVGQAGTAVLFTREQVTVPVVPVTAILTEAGRPYLFVQAEGESFEKRMVQLGPREGDRVGVVGGVKPGERVVTRGAYDVQLASAAKGLPAEGHVH
jgi:membrane fusion protein, heavy metal efflux system